jgi:hypothetical protein
LRRASSDPHLPAPLLPATHIDPLRSSLNTTPRVGATLQQTCRSSSEISGTIISLR